MLENDQHLKAVHYRMKGVSLDCVKLYAESLNKVENTNEKLYKLYNSLCNGESHTFNLLTTQVLFKNDTKTRTIKNQKNFTRRQQFKGEYIEVK